MEIEMKCRICSGISNETKYTFHEKYFGSNEEFEYFECNKCECIQISDFPKNIGKYYGKDYYSFNDDPQETERKYSFKKKILNKLYIKRDKYSLLKKGFSGYFLDYLRKNDEKKLSSLMKLNLNIDLKILDVGCGSGNLLYYMKNLGFRNLEGIDPFIDKSFKYKNNLEIRKAEIQNLVDENKKYDVIMLHHVLEHVEDPVKTFKILNEILKEDGILIIRIPIKDSYAWKTYKENWVQLDAPRHFHIFSLNSINHLCSLSNFEIKNLYYDSSDFQFIGSEQYKRNISLISENSYYVNQNASGFSKEEINDYKKAAEKLNNSCQGDQVVLYLTKNKVTKEWMSR